MKYHLSVSNLFLILFFQFFSVIHSMEIPISIPTDAQDQTLAKSLDTEILDLLKNMLDERNTAFDRIHIPQEDCVRSSTHFL